MARALQKPQHQILDEYSAYELTELMGLRSLEVTEEGERKRDKLMNELAT